GAAERASGANARAKAAGVRSLAQDGPDFAALAEQFSEGPGARRGGALGTFGRGEMEHDLEQAAFALEAGTVSEPVRAGGGFHLLRVDQRIGAGPQPVDVGQGASRHARYSHAAAVVAAIASAGLRVLDIGVCPTPLMYFSLFHWDLDGGIQVTGSHNPPDYNGFKICLGKDALHGEQIQDLRRHLEAGRFETG